MIRPSALIILASTLLGAAPAALAQDTTASQQSSPVRPFGLTDRAQLVYQLQDGKGKAMGTIRNQVVSFDTEQNKKQTITSTTALLKSGTYDSKSKLLNIQDLHYAYRQDTTFTDGTSELDPGRLSSFRDRIFNYEPTPLVWPTYPTVGSSLPGGGVSVQVSSTAVSIAKVYTNVQKRKVVSGPAPITTPAGTFQCYKVESERESATMARADMVFRTVQRMIDYYSPEVGIVRTELYDKKGKLEVVRVLASRTTSAAEATLNLQQKTKIKLK